MAASHNVSFGETWHSIPVITRSLGSLSILLYAVRLALPYQVMNFWLLPGYTYKWQVWRYATAPLSCMVGGISGLFTVFTFCSNLQRLELGGFRTPSDLAFYILFISAVFCLVAPKLGCFAFLEGLACALSYTVSQEAPLEQVMFLGLITIKHVWLPWTNALIGAVTGGYAGLIQPLLGIFAAHLFLFLNELLPRAGGPALLPKLKPTLLYRLDQKSEVPPTFGRGRRLGS